MSTRERWIVYPLLFMTLGIALRDKVIPPTHLGNPNMQFVAAAIAAPQVQCGELRVGRVVCDRLESKRVEAERMQSRRLESDQVESRQSESHTFVVKGPGNRPAVVAGTDPNTKAGIIETLAANGLPQVRLHSTESGGTVTAIERAGNMQLILGDQGRDFGLFVKLPGVGPLVSLTLPPWHFETKPAEPKSPKEPPPKP